MAEPSGPATWRERLLGLGIVFHLVAVTLLASPAPAPLKGGEDWADPNVSTELGVWSEALRSAGVDVSDAQLSARVFELQGSWLALRREALWPLRRYAALTGADQRWRMFTSAHTHPARLQVQVHQEGAWHTIYQARDPQRDWQARKLDSSRGRAVVFAAPWPSARPRYDGFVDWLSRLAAQDFPDASHARVRFWRAATPTPAEARAGIEPPGAWALSRIRDLDRYR